MCCFGGTIFFCTSTVSTVFYYEYYDFNSFSNLCRYDPKLVGEIDNRGLVELILSVAKTHNVAPP